MDANRVRRTARRLILALAVALAVTSSSGGTAVAEPSTATTRTIAVARAVAWPLPNHPRLDQGQDGVCGVFAPLQALNMLPGRPIPQAVASLISREVQATLADRPANDILTAALARHGIHATFRALPAGADAALTAVRGGPVVIEVPFYQGFYETHPSGQWVPSGRYLSLTHAVVLYGYQPAQHRVLIINQWGRWWGIDGTAWLSEAHFRRLMSDTQAGARAAVWARVPQ